MDKEKWKIFQTQYCKKQGGYFRFDNENKITNDKNYEIVKGCCIRAKYSQEIGDNWQKCEYNNCPFLKEPRKEKTWDYLTQANQLVLAEALTKDGQ